MPFVVTAVWIVATVIAFSNGRRSLALFSLCLGSALAYALFTGKLGYPGIIGLALLAIVLVIINKFDMR
jgi:hypothetical protein